MYAVYEILPLPTSVILYELAAGNLKFWKLWVFHRSLLYTPGFNKGLVLLSCKGMKKLNIAALAVGVSQ